MWTVRSYTEMRHPECHGRSVARELHVHLIVMNRSANENVFDVALRLTARRPCPSTRRAFTKLVANL
jgi:hypothetical protein